MPQCEYQFEDQVDSDYRVVTRARVRVHRGGDCRNEATVHLIYSRTDPEQNPTCCDSCAEILREIETADYPILEEIRLPALPVPVVQTS